MDHCFRQACCKNRKNCTPADTSVGRKCLDDFLTNMLPKVAEAGPHLLSFQVGNINNLNVELPERITRFNHVVNSLLGAYVVI